MALLVIAGGALYATRLGEVPAYLIHDETQGALQAHAIATTGRDLSGRRLPLYFTEPEFPPGRDPILIYVTALGLQVLPFSEAGVRIPTALIATLNVVLAFLVARRWFQSTAMGLLAAMLLLFTPVHFIRGRLILSPLYTIPFILGWLWLLARFDSAPTTRRLVGAGVMLGAGVYSYLAAVVMMPLYLLATLAIGFRRLGLAPALKAGLAFAVVLIPMLAWYIAHPERNTEIVSAYQLETTARSPLARSVGLYWSFFDPSFLFVSGDASLINSTRSTGLFPAAFALLIPIGLFGLLSSAQAVPLVIAAGLITAPLVSVISGAVEMNRIMFAIPFGVLAASYGAHMLLRSHRTAARAAAVVAAVVGAVAVRPVVFGVFGNYRVASAAWLDGGVREAVRATMAHAGNTKAPIYISNEIEWIHRTWRFYANSDRKPDMIDRAVYTTEPPRDAEAGSLVLCPTGSARCRPSALWRVVETATSLDGSRTFSILRRATIRQRPQATD